MMMRRFSLIPPPLTNWREGNSPNQHACFGQSQPFGVDHCELVLDKAGEMVPFSDRVCEWVRKPTIPENPSKGGLMKAPKCNYHPSLVQRTLLLLLDLFCCYCSAQESENCPKTPEPRQQRPNGGKKGIRSRPIDIMKWSRRCCENSGRRNQWITAGYRFSSYFSFLPVFDIICSCCSCCCSIKIPISYK